MRLNYPHTSHHRLVAAYNLCTNAHQHFGYFYWRRNETEACSNDFGVSFLPNLLKIKYFLQESCWEVSRPLERHVRTVKTSYRVVGTRRQKILPKVGNNVQQKKYGESLKIIGVPPLVTALSVIRRPPAGGRKTKNKTILLCLVLRKGFSIIQHIQQN